MKQDQPTPLPPPDPYEVASAQTGSNISTAIANATIGNANQVGPYGTTTYDQTGYQTVTGPQGETYQIPRYTQTTKLSPEQQALYEGQTAIGRGFNDIALNQTRRIGDTLGTPIDAASLAPGGDYGPEARARVEQAMFDRINPQLQRDRDALENRLVNQGFQRGTDAFSTAMDEYGRQVNDQRLGITATGLAEQQGQFGMGQARRAQSLQELLALRNQPINEISALRSGGQVSLPQVQGYNAPTIGGTPIGDYTYNSAALKNQQYANQLAGFNAELGGIYGLAGAAVGGGSRAAAAYASDRRLKTDIVDLGIRLVNGLKLYAYKYLWEPTVERVGVMADEVLLVRPEAVAVDNRGYLMVDYRAL